MFLLQILSIEDVEKIMDETNEAVEYQRVGAHLALTRDKHTMFVSQKVMLS